MSTGLKMSMARREDDETLFSRTDDGRLVRLDKVTAADLQRDVTITIDGRSITVKKATVATDANGVPLRDEQGKAIPRPTTVYDAACAAFPTGTVMRAADLVENPIPILCHREHLNPVAVCRLCVVEVSQVKRGQRRTERKLYPACQLRVDDTMEISSRATSETVRKTVDTLTELLMADHPSPCAKEKQTRDCELEALARNFELPPPRFARRPPGNNKDDSSVVIAVDHGACIMCDRCVRSCNDVRDNQVIGRARKGYKAKIAFDLDNPMGNSSCVACGECMVYCPTGALTNKTVVDQKPWEGKTPAPERIDIETDLLRNPIPEIRRSFRGATPAFLRWNEGSIVRRRYKAGEIICREGEYEATAFLIESGSVDIFLNSTLGHAQSRQTGSKGLFGLLKNYTVDLIGSRTAKGEGRFIAIDAPVALDSAKPAATLKAGDIFGEMACMNAYPRGATVRASGDVVVLEFMRNVLYIMQRNKNFRAALEAKYRERAIANHLRSVSIFAPLRDDEAQFNRFVDSLRDSVKLTRADPGDVIFRQGDRGDDGFYLVRSGFVKVAQRRPGGEHVLNYVGPGGYFGEIALMADVPEIRALSEAGLRTATCSALDHVDLVQITANEFRDLLARFPKIREPLVKEAIRRLEENAEALRRAEAVPLGEFLSQGLMNASSLLVLDLEKCTRCDECTKACSDTHEGVTRLIREGLRFDKFLVASSCRSCLDPYCLVGCPTGAIGRKGTLEILIDDTCIGCGRCAENCPYGNINMHGFNKRIEDPARPQKKIAVVQQKATMCDLCHDIGTPSCVYACPHDAAHRMTGRELIDLVELRQMR